jgi:hypothetical protein
MAKVNQREVIRMKAEDSNGVEGKAAVRFNYKYLGGRWKGDRAGGAGYEWGGRLE